jgi:hypothetical protein
VNKIHNLETRAQKFPNFRGNLAKFGGTFLVLKVELDPLGKRLKDAKFRVLISEKQQDLGSLRRVQLKIQRSYDQEFLRARTRLDMEQLWFRTSILITPRTWCKSKANNFLQNLDNTTPMHERYSSL